MCVQVRDDIEVLVKLKGRKLILITKFYRCIVLPYHSRGLVCRPLVFLPVDMTLPQLIL